MSATMARPSKHHIEGLRGALYVRVSKAKDTGRGEDTERTDKSTEDQERDGREIFTRRGIQLAGVFADPDISASRFAVKRNRPDFERMLTLIRNGGPSAPQIIWFWELSRQQRRLDVFADLRELTRDRGVLWMVGETVYEPWDYRDMLMLGLLSVVAEGESEIKSENVRRGTRSNAAAGLPHGPVSYGWKRLYTPGPPGRRLRESLAGQVPDALKDGVALAPGEVPTMGQLVPDSPAFVIAEMYRRFAAGWGMDRIALDITRRGIPTSRKAGVGRSSDHPRWRGTTVRKYLTNPAYAGMRVHQGKVLELPEGVTPAWTPLVSRELFWEVQARFADPARTSFRQGSGPSVHFLSGVARCGACGQVLQRWKKARLSHGHYACVASGCQRVSIRQDVLDEYVNDKMLLWLSDPAVYGALKADSDSAEAASARALAIQLRTELAEVRELALDRKMSPTMAASMEARLLERISEAEDQERSAALPPVLKGNVGPAAVRQWVSVLDNDVKKLIIRAVADIRVMPIGKGHYITKGNIRRPVGDRIEWTWLLGDGEQGS
jgi:DNA invertase Pin-like site-specific DNA recombinase